ncbi:MAG: hypothetical protein M0Q13_12280 [Methanothrix sp.]|jgi:hypothetical protein|nr:hypothetical protein [Methanothrix sp.]
MEDKLIIPFYYTKQELENILKINNIDFDTDIFKCKQYMALNGWCLSKKKLIKNKDVLVSNLGVIKKIINFNGIEININKRNVIVSSIMENERDCMIVCIIEAIKKEIY